METKTTMQFLEDVKTFLYSQYPEGYEFETKRYIALPPQFAPYYSKHARMELVISTKPYKKIIVNENMQKIYEMYKTGYYYPERGEFEWQKELIDMIEGS